MDSEGLRKRGPAPSVVETNNSKEKTKIDSKIELDDNSSKPKERTRSSDVTDQLKEDKVGESVKEDKRKDSKEEKDKAKDSKEKQSENEKNSKESKVCFRRKHKSDTQLTETEFEIRQP
jgi:hypothetical protein